MYNSQRSSRFVIVFFTFIAIVVITVTTKWGSVGWFSAAAATPDTELPTSFSQQGPKLFGSGGVGNASQGQSVSISADGNTALVGGGFDNNIAGAVWVWIRISGVWTQQGSKLVGSGALLNAQQGYAVSLSADGNTALVGGPDDTTPGAAWVWTRSGGVWTQQGAKLVGTGAVGNARQGSSVAISADGNTAIVGAVRDDSFTGAAWVWTRSGSVWTQQGSKLVGSGAVGTAQQGYSVSLSADGNTAFVGGALDGGSVGAAWVWTRSGSIWTQQGSKLVGSGAVGAARQGYSVSLSDDGNTALVGGGLDNADSGATWVWTRSGSIWTQQGPKLVGSGAVGAARQGFSVSLSDDGNTALVGGALDNANLGAIWVWTRSGNIWTQQGSKLVGSGSVGAAEQGYSVSLSGDGSTALVGGNRDNAAAGATWVFYAPTTVLPVTSTADSGAGSLRQAILDANAAAGLDTISFAIPGGGVKTISPLSPLPTITGPVIIDGYTQPGSSPNTNATGGLNTALMIELNGTNAGNTNGLLLTGGGSTVKGLIINRFSQYGIFMTTNGGNAIQGNFLGTDSSGTVDLGNTGNGVSAGVGSSNNSIGGTTAGARNLISGNNAIGVSTQIGSSLNLVQGNLIGTDVTGTLDLGNTNAGVYIFSSTNNTIGGTTPGARNVISGNNSYGVILDTSGATGNQVQGNFIGTNASGTAAISNGSHGLIMTGSPGNTIGGTSPGAGNIVSGNNGCGIEITNATGSPGGTTATLNIIQGNFIGTQLDGIAPLGNSSHGVCLFASGGNNSVGGTVAGSGNTIAFNGGVGVRLASNSGLGNVINLNSIFSNTSFGIDLTGDGVTPNDSGDGDTGTNNLQNFPVLTSAVSSGGSTTIQGTLNSTADTAFRIEFFSNPTCDPSGNGEGQTFLGSMSVTTVGNNAAINSVLPVGVALGQFVTATATDPNSNTSEFSACLAVTAGGTPTPTATPTATPTSTPTSTPTATPTPGAGFEGDVAPRPSGDGIVVSNDVVQLRRFATGLDIPNPGFNELQRADGAPRSTGGDGVINSGDVVQGRRYATGLDPLTDAGGPTAPSLVPDSISGLIEDIKSYFYGRELRVGSTMAESEKQVVVPVEMTPNGDEAAISFTIEYDPKMLGNPRITLGEFAPAGSTLTYNVDDMGRIGILIDSAESMTASAMPKEIVMITFDVVADSVGDTNLSLTSSLASRSIFDELGNSLTTRYVDGIVHIFNE